MVATGNISVPGRISLANSINVIKLESNNLPITNASNGAAIISSVSPIPGSRKDVSPIKSMIRL